MASGGRRLSANSPQPKRKNPGASNIRDAK